MYEEVRNMYGILVGQPHKRLEIFGAGWSVIVKWILNKQGVADCITLTEDTVQ